MLRQLASKSGTVYETDECLSHLPFQDFKLLTDLCLRLPSSSLYIDITPKDGFDVSDPALMSADTPEYSEVGGQRDGELKLTLDQVDQLGPAVPRSRR